MIWTHRQILYYAQTFFKTMHQIIGRSILASSKVPSATTAALTKSNVSTTTTAITALILLLLLRRTPPRQTCRLAALKPCCGASPVLQPSETCLARCDLPCVLSIAVSGFPRAQRRDDFGSAKRSVKRRSVADEDASHLPGRRN